MICSTALGYAQSFLGIEYGTPYNETYSQLYERFHENCDKSGESIVIYSPQIVNCVFDAGMAYFSVVDGKSVLDGGLFFKECPISETEDQIARQEALIASLEEKYGDDTDLVIEDNGTKTLYFGKALTQSDKWLGCIYIVFKYDDDVCALVLNYNRVLGSRTRDL